MKNFSLKTKESYHRSSKLHPLTVRLLWIGVAFFVLFVGRHVVGSATSFITNPFYFVRHYLETSTASAPTFFRDRESLLTYIRDLEETLIREKEIRAMNDVLEQENAELRALLGATSSPRIVASVVSRPPETPYDALVIDRGTRDGIILYAPVFQGKDSVIGYIERVYDTTARVTLFSTPGVESTVFVFGANIFTTAYGEGGGIVRLTIPQGIPVAEGDQVLLPMLEHGLLGVVHAVESSPTEPEQRAYVSTAIPLQSLRLVSVGSTSLEPTPFEEAIEVVEETQKRFTFIVPEGESHALDLSTSTTSTTVPTAGTSTETNLE